jgi:hypothetical protein
MENKQLIELLLNIDRMFKVMIEQNLYEPIYFPPSFKPNSVLLILFNLQKIEYWDTVSIFLDENYRITNEKAREITGIKDTLTMVSKKLYFHNKVKKP